MTQRPPSGDDKLTDPSEDPTHEPDRLVKHPRRTLGLKKTTPSGVGPTAGEDGLPASSAPRAGLRARFKPGGLKPKRLASKDPGSTQATGERDMSAAPPKSPRRGFEAERPRRYKSGPDKPPSIRAGEAGRGDRVTPRADDIKPGPLRPARISPRPQPGLDSTDPRLAKLMAERGLCSRREADEIIERGWVFVDGKRVSTLGTRVSPDVRVELAPEALARFSTQVTILLHKPVGYVSGQPEPGYEPAVALIGPDNQFDRDTAQRFHHSHLRGLAPAGRLDIDSTGLLVLTQNGRVARQLIGEDSKVEKEYLVRVEGVLDARGLALLNHGLELDGRHLRPAHVEWINQDQLRFVLREGRKRQIRRMCECVGLKVTGLKRVRIGKVKLGDLPLGEWRFLGSDEAF